MYVHRYKDRVVNITQEPVVLYDRLIRNHTLLDETVLEVFAGSGSGAVAALLAGRNCVSVESEHEQCRGIEARILELQRIVFYFRDLPAADNAEIRQVTPAELDSGLTEFKAIDEVERQTSKVTAAHRKKMKAGMRELGKCHMVTM